MVIYEECTKDMVIPKGLGRNGGMKEYKAGKNIQIIEDVINCTIDTDKLSTKTDVDEKIENSLTGYATEEYVQQQVIEAGSVTTDIVEEMIDESLLNYYTQTETDAEIEEKINNQTFKTINGESIKGEGNIEIHGAEGDYLPLSGGRMSGNILLGDGTNEKGVYLDGFRSVSGKTHHVAIGPYQNGAFFAKHLYDGTEDSYMLLDGTGLRVRYSGENGKYVTTDTIRNVVDSKTVQTIWTGTKAEYNALSVIDNNTLYIIQN